MRLFLRLLIALIFLASAPMAFACSCVALNGTCGAAKAAGTLFLGEVIEKRTVNVPAEILGRKDLYFRKVVVNIRVTEAFAGKPAAGETIAVMTGSGGGDCGFAFVVGKRYLVDAYQPGQDTEAESLRSVAYATSICSHTQPEDGAGILLAELRTERERGRQPDLHGSVRYLESRFGYPGTPVAGVEIALTADKDGSTYRAQTNAEGIYEFASLPPGGYRPSLILPAQQAVIQYADAKPLHVEIPPNDGTGMACHLDIAVGSSGGIAGRVNDATGKPLEGSVSARRQGARQEQMSGADSNGDGTFHLEYLPDGEYTLEFQSWASKMHGTGSASVRGGQVTTGVNIVALPAGSGK